MPVEQAIAKLKDLRHIQRSGEKYDWTDYFECQNRQENNPCRYPPALLCDICGNLMCFASLTPCCQLNGCYACIEARVMGLRDLFA